MRTMAGQYQYGRHLFSEAVFANVPTKDCWSGATMNTSACAQTSSALYQLRGNVRGGILPLTHQT